MRLEIRKGFVCLTGLKRLLRVVMVFVLLLVVGVGIGIIVKKRVRGWVSVEGLVEGDRIVVHTVFGCSDSVWLLHVGSNRGDVVGISCRRNDVYVFLPNDVNFERYDTVHYYYGWNLACLVGSIQDIRYDTSDLPLVLVVRGVHGVVYYSYDSRFDKELGMVEWDSFMGSRWYSYLLGLTHDDLMSIVGALLEYIDIFSGCDLESSFYLYLLPSSYFSCNDRGDRVEVSICSSSGTRNSSSTERPYSPIFIVYVYRDSSDFRRFSISRYSVIDEFDNLVLDNLMCD